MKAGHCINLLSTITVTNAMFDNTCCEWINLVRIINKDPKAYSQAEVQFVHKLSW